MEETLSIFSLSLLDFKLICLGTLGTYVFAWLAGKTLFKPHLKVIERREELTEGARERTEYLTKETAQIHEQIEEALQSTRTTLNEERAAAVLQAQKKAESIVSAAEHEAAAILSRGRSEISLHLSKLSNDLENSIPELVEMAHKTALGQTH